MQASTARCKCTNTVSKKTNEQPTYYGIEEKYQLDYVTVQYMQAAKMKIFIFELNHWERTLTRNSNQVFRQYTCQQTRPKGQNIDLELEQHFQTSGIRALQLTKILETTPFVSVVSKVSLNKWLRLSSDLQKYVCESPLSFK